MRLPVKSALSFRTEYGLSDSKARICRNKQFGMKLFFRWAQLNRSPAITGSNGVCGLSLPGTGMALANALLNSDCLHPGSLQLWILNWTQLGGPAAPASRRSRINGRTQTAPALKPAAQGRTAFMASGCSSAMSGRRGSGDIRFMIGGRRPKADHVDFFDNGCQSTARNLDKRSATGLLASGMQSPASGRQYWGILLPSSTQV